MKIIRILSLLAAIAVNGFAQKIEFTYVPAPGSYDFARFKTTGVDVTKFGVTGMINVFGTFWTKPYWASPVMEINPDGTGTINLTTGGQDACAQTIYLFVVPLNSSFTLGTGGTSIPADLQAQTIAQVSAQKTSPDQGIKIFDLDWDKKDTGACIWGPGPNSFSGNNAFVDTQGRLHLRISYAHNAWQCAEIISRQSLGYGTYTITVDTDLSKLPGQIVFGVFTYDDNPDFAHREIDYEFSNGDVVGLPNPHQYVVQPYNVTGHRVRFNTKEFPLKHTFTWLPNFVSFSSFANNAEISGTTLVYDIESARDPSFKTLLDLSVTSVTFSPPGSVEISGIPTQKDSLFYRARLVNYVARSSSPSIKQVTLTDAIPPAAEEKLHINLWLFQGMEPGSLQTEVYEVVVSKLSFEPLDLTKVSPRMNVSKKTATSFDINVGLP